MITITINTAVIIPLLIGVAIGFVIGGVFVYRRYKLTLRQCDKVLCRDCKDKINMLS
jgi:cytochrome bd-type quinol oxidase subunit 2